MIHDPGTQIDIAKDIITTIRTIDRLKLFCPFEKCWIIIMPCMTPETLRVSWRWHDKDGKEMSFSHHFNLLELENLNDPDHRVTKMLYSCQFKMEKAI